MENFYHEESRMSELPDSLICHILSFLPTKRAVTTCILSKRWKTLWTEVTTINFNCYDSKSFQFINAVLHRHSAENCRLHKFRLMLQKGLDTEKVTYVDSWISYAISRNVRVLDLNLNLNLNLMNIFTYHGLQFLRLCGPFRTEIPNLVSLPQLEDLELNRVSFDSDKCVDTLIAGCPMLHSLKINRINEDEELNIRISSSSLRRLEVTANFNVGKLRIKTPNLDYLNLEFNELLLVECFVNQPTCVKLSIYSVSLNQAHLCNAIVKLVEDFKFVKFLTIYEEAMKRISRATVPLSTTFTRLTRLDVFFEYSDWSCLSFLLACSVKLQILNVVNRDGKKGRYWIHKQCWKEPETVPECLSDSLAHFSFKGFGGEIEMIKYVLKHGAVLESVELESRKFTMMEMVSEVFSSMLSSACSVSFNGETLSSLSTPCTQIALPLSPGFKVMICFITFLVCVSRLPIPH